MMLNFFIDKDHYPYAYQNDLSFDNKELLDTLGGTNTWLLWTLRTYMELSPVFNCCLADEMPDSGIIFFFRGSVSLTQKPNPKQFWVCMVADGTWHPYSHINIFQNTHGLKRNIESYFIRHWQQLSIIKSQSANLPPVNIYYMGDLNNLTPELRSADWQDFLTKHGYVFKTPNFAAWNDYSEIDILIGIRSFKTTNHFFNKPSSKLINAWRGHVVFIGGIDSAYTHEKQTPFDYIRADSYEGLKQLLVELKSNTNLFQRYRHQAKVCADRFPDSFFVQQWTSLINENILPSYQRFLRLGKARYYSFILSRLLRYKSEALLLRTKKIFSGND